MLQKFLCGGVVDIVCVMFCQQHVFVDDGLLVLVVSTVFEVICLFRVEVGRVLGLVFVLIVLVIVVIKIILILLFSNY